MQLHQHQGDRGDTGAGRARVIAQFSSFVSLFQSMLGQA
jgi:hypothetical protein